MPDSGTDREQMRVGHATQSAELERTLALLTEAQELANVGSAVLDLETGGLEWSPQVYRICGVDPDTFVLSLENAMKIVHPHDIQAVTAGVARAGEGAPFDLDFRVVRGDGEIRYVQTRTCVGRRADGTPSSIRGTMLDVTERRNMERRVRRSQRLEVLGTLAGGIAHNLNNYLQILAGSVDLLLDADEAEEIDDARTNIHHALRLCASLADGLLDLSQDRPFLPEVTDIHCLLRQSFELVTFVLEPRIETRFELAAERCHVRCDPRQLGQAFVNLALNARDAIEGAGSISVHTRSADAALTIEFTDTGHGIPPTELAKVFDPFFTTKSPGRGTGLGLSVTHASVRQCGGTIAATSRVDEGTTITVRLPLVDAGREHT